MIEALKGFADRFLGRGSAALTVPPLDGALKPNNRLEELPAGIRGEAPDCLAVRGGQIVWAEGNRIQAETGPIGQAGGEITALAASPAGRVAVASIDGGVAIDGIVPKALADLACVTALAFDGEDVLWIAIGSTLHKYTDWSRDFLELRRAGQVLRFDIGTGTMKLVAAKLGHPKGILPAGDGVIVSESWAKHLIRIDGAGRISQLMEDLPGYPAGIAPSSSGGYWLAIFAPRGPLLELVLREPAYRRAMMAEVEPEFWIAPALKSGYSFREPMQGGALKQMGILKPWAPTRSYGLVVELDRSFTPIQSFHSRAGGRRHGVTSVVELDGTLWATSKGGDEVLKIALGRGMAA
ncbi:hypothetical protein [Dongia sp.]|uniref:hypothetical protein n=1 Tax=Dongia sp. TaxID=1977262 RepID=UPI0035B14D58